MAGCARPLSRNKPKQASRSKPNITSDRVLRFEDVRQRANEPFPEQVMPRPEGVFGIPPVRIAPHGARAIRIRLPGVPGMHMTVQMRPRVAEYLVVRPQEARIQLGARPSNGLTENGQFQEKQHPLGPGEVYQVVRGTTVQQETVAWQVLRVPNNRPAGPHPTENRWILSTLRRSHTILTPVHPGRPLPCALPITLYNDHMFNSAERRAAGRLADFSEGQWGFITVEQAGMSGAPPEMVQELMRARLLESTFDGVFRVRGGARHPFPKTYSMWLLLNPVKAAWERDPKIDGILSHGSAARIYEALSVPGPYLELTLPETVAPPAATPHLDWFAHRRSLTDDEWCDVYGLPVTTPARTLIDLAKDSPVDLADLGKMAYRLLAKGLSTRDTLIASLDRYVIPEGLAASGHEWLDILLDNDLLAS